MENNEILKGKYMAITSMLHAISEFAEDRIANSFGLFAMKPKELTQQDIIDIKTIFDDCYNKIVYKNESNPQIYLDMLTKKSKEINPNFNLNDGNA